MTCIVGIKEHGSVYLGGDSAAIDVTSFGIHVRNEPKVFRNGPLLMGFTDSFRMGQILQYCLKVPDHPVGMDDMTYLVTLLIVSIRETFSEGGYIGEDEKQEPGGQFLLGYNRNLYVVDTDFHIGSIRENYVAIGCGEQYALGALYAMSNTTLSTQLKLNLALSAAEFHCAGVKGPFTVMEL